MEIWRGNSIGYKSRCFLETHLQKDFICLQPNAHLQAEDRLPDTRERNEIIWNNCLDRLEIGASLALFLKAITIPKKLFAH